MTALRWSAIVLREQQRRLVALAAGHAALAASVAWYLVESAWGGAPIAASLTPLPVVAFHGTWLAGAALLGVVAPALGAAAVPATVGPATPLPLTTPTRAWLGWSAATLATAFIALAGAPAHVALHELGAFTAADLARPAAVYLGLVALGPALGAGGRAWRDRRSARP
jgi:hypothetical protein